MKIVNMKNKTFKELETQYKRVLRLAFPKLRFKGILWNWDKVYDEDPYNNPTFLKIHNAFVSAAKNINHPFYSK